MIKFLKSMICAFLWHDIKGERGTCKRCGKIIIPIR
jgi:hypothetical protein